MSSFNYFDGVREDVGNMISEIGTSCLVKVPTRTTDAFGNLTLVTYPTTATEVIWVRPMGEVLDIQGVGQFDREDLRFLAKFDTIIVLESIITYGGIEYVVLSIDKPDVAGNTTHKVGYAKKKLS